MADDRLKEALVITSKRIMFNALRLDYAVAPEWDNYPEIGENDWLAIEAIIDKHRDGTLGVTDDYYDAAYQFLSQRADAE